MKNKIIYILLFLLLLVGCTENKSTCKVIFIMDDEISMEMNIDKGSVLDEPEETLDMEKDNLVFDGWYYNEEKWDFNNPIDEDITLVAKWKEPPKVITVIFDSDGGTEIQKLEILEGTIIASPDVPERVASEFVGWFYENELFDFTKPINESITLKAKWSTLDNTKDLFNLSMTDYFNSWDFGQLDLPTQYADLRIAWRSSDDSIINSNGEFIRPYKAKQITLQATVYSDQGSSSFSYKINVPGYKELNVGNIASCYVYREYGSLTEEFFDTMDIITCAFITGNSDGSLTGTNYLYNVKNYVIPEAHKRGDYVIMSIAPSSSWETICNPANNRIDKFVDNIVKMINEYGFDGVDIDWEYPKSGQYTWFTTLVKTLREKVKANNSNHLVTAAIAGGTWQPAYFDLKNSNKYLDYINMMTYGMDSGNKRYQNALYKSSSGKTLSSCSIDESIKIYKGYGIGPERILVGLAFYGIRQRNENGTFKNDGSIFYTSISKSIKNGTYVEYYDEECQVPYALTSDGNYFISYDNPRSIKVKCDYVSSKGIAGVTYWENGCDNTGELLHAITESFNK